MPRFLWSPRAGSGVEEGMRGDISLGWEGVCEGWRGRRGVTGRKGMGCWGRHGMTVERMGDKKKTTKKQTNKTGVGEGGEVQTGWRRRLAVMWNEEGERGKWFTLLQISPARSGWTTNSSLMFTRATVGHYVHSNFPSHGDLVLLHSMQRDCSECSLQEGCFSSALFCFRFVGFFF